MSIDPYNLFPDLGIKDFLYFTKPFGYIVLILIILVFILIYVSWRKYYKDSSETQIIISLSLSIIVTCAVLSYLYMINQYDKSIEYVKVTGEEHIHIDLFLRALYLMRLIPLANVVLIALLIFVFLPMLLKKWNI